MKESGFTPLIVIIGLVVATAIAGGSAYYFSVIPGIGPDKELSSAKDKQNWRVVQTSQPFLKEQASPSSNLKMATNSIDKRDSDKQNSFRLPSALEILKNRLLQKNSSPKSSSHPFSTPAQNPTPNPSQIATPNPSPTPTSTPTPVPAPTPNCNLNTSGTNTTVSANSSGASLALSPTSGAFKKDGTFSIQINFDPKSHNNIDAIDALLQFDKNKITAVSIEEKISQIAYPSKILDNYGGKIILSLLDTYYTGKLNSTSTLAIVNFRINTAASDTTEIKFNFDVSNPSSTADSNVVERNNVNDVLGSVTNGLYAIKPDGCN